MNNLAKKVFSRNPPEILNKQECYALYDEGFFGNKPLTWSSYEEIMESDYRGLVCMRAKVPSFKTQYDLDLQKIPRILFKIEKQIPLDKLVFNQSMPNEHLTIQGEITRYLGWHLLYTNSKKPMKLGFEEEQKRASGLKAKSLIETSMDPSSYSDLQVLFDLFPNSSIEFSTYEVDVGNIKNRNTIFWEVRNY